MRIGWGFQGRASRSRRLGRDRDKVEREKRQMAKAAQLEE